MRGSALVFPRQQVVGDRFEGLRRRAERLEGRPCFRGQLVRLFLCASQAQQRGISRLLRLEVLARALAQFFAGLGYVENVVDDLKGEAKAIPELGQTMELSG